MSVLLRGGVGAGILFAVAFVVAARMTAEELAGNAATCLVGGGCRAVLASPPAHLGPVPTSALGAAASAVLASLAVLGGKRPLLFRWLAGIASLVCVALQAYALGFLQAACWNCFAFCSCVWLGSWLGWQGLGFPDRASARFLAVAVVTAMGVASLLVAPPAPAFQSGLEHLPTEEEAQGLAPHGWVGRQPKRGERWMLVVADPLCGHCQRRVPRLVDSALRQDDPLAVAWAPGSQGGVDFAAIGQALLQVRQPQRLADLLDLSQRPFDASKVRRTLGWSQEELSRVLHPESFEQREVLRQGSTLHAWGSRRTPVLLEFAGGRVAELDPQAEPAAAP